MEENKQKIRYDYELLKQYIEKNGIVLTNNYNEQKITRETIIEAKCLTEGCADIVSKKFRHFLKIGSYCKKCSDIRGREKMKHTNLEKFGVEFASQAQVIKNKVKSSNLERFGVEYASQSQDIKNKVKQTCLEKLGVEYALQSKQVKEKGKITNLEKYSCEHHTQNKEIRKK